MITIKILSQKYSFTDMESGTYMNSANRNMRSL